MNTDARSIRQILNAIEASRSICVAGHVRPDGDCVGSQLALTRALKQLGKQVVCWNQHEIPHKFAFLDSDHLFRQPTRRKKFDLVFAADCASLERMGTVAEFIGSPKQFINVDHHPSNTRYGNLNWIVPERPSTGELIFALMKAARWKIDASIADCLFAAISTDTGSFQYPNTDQRTFNVAGELAKLGADIAGIAQRVYHSASLPRVKLLRHVYRTFKLAHGNRIAYFSLTSKILKQTGASRGDTEGLIDHVRAIEPVIVACLFEHGADGCMRVSLRSKDAAVDVNAIAKRFGGGGHRLAAGARVEGTPASVQRRILAAVRQSINEAVS